MTETWSIGYHPNAICSNCGAEYEVKYRRIPHKERDSFSCEDCDTQIARWNTTEDRTYTKLKHGALPPTT